MSVREWFQLFRAQTAPADVCFLSMAFLSNHPFFSVEYLAVLFLVYWVHNLSFGQNSLEDYAKGYDMKDPSKSHHPLSTGAITVPEAINVIYWGLAIVLSLVAFMTVIISPAPAYSFTGLLLWVVWGWGYNCGLSKESLFGWLSISVCFTGLGMWAWFLSSETLGIYGAVYLYYIFLTVLYQIAWSGFVKDFDTHERSNIIEKLGARMIGDTFLTEGAGVLAFIVKLVSIIPLWFLALTYGTLFQQSWVIGIGFGVMMLTIQATRPRIYDREKELVTMSLVEILSIYLPMYLYIEPIPATILMISGIMYFYGVNKWLWGKGTPGV